MGKRLMEKLEPEPTMLSQISERVAMIHGEWRGNGTQA